MGRPPNLRACRARFPLGTQDSGVRMASPPMPGRSLALEREFPGYLPRFTEAPCKFVRNRTDLTTLHIGSRWGARTQYQTRHKAIRGGPAAMRSQAFLALQANRTAGSELWPGSPR